jgi:hypothetical protein
MTEERMWEIVDAFGEFIDEHVPKVESRSSDPQAQAQVFLLVLDCGPEAIVTGILKRVPDTNVAEIVEALGEAITYHQATTAVLQLASNSLLAGKGRFGG